MSTVHPIKQWLEATGRRQSELARLAGIDQALLSRIISGKQLVSAETAIAIADATGIKTDVLVRLGRTPGCTQSASCADNTAS